jgi:predicted LPLAT superfamily acyltransferase
MSENRAWVGKTGGGNIGQRGLMLLFNLFGLRSLYAILAFVVPFYMLFSHKGYLAIYRYFRRQFGYSVWKSFCWTYKNHFRFGQVILDRFAVFAGKNPFEVEIVGNDYFQRLSDGKKGFVIVGSHVGNFEIGGYLLHSDKKAFNAVAFGGETETVQQNRSKLLTNNNIKLIPVRQDMSHLFAANVALQNGEVLLIAADRIFGSSKSMECEFINGKADFPVGALALAAAFEVEVLALFCIKISAKKYKIFVKPVCDNSAADMRQAADDMQKKNRKSKIGNQISQYAKEVEKIVRQYPEQWFNFYEFWN